MDPNRYILDHSSTFVIVVARFEKKANSFIFIWQSRYISYKYGKPLAIASNLIDFHMTHENNMCEHFTTSNLRCLLKALIVWHFIVVIMWMLVYQSFQWHYVTSDLITSHHYDIFRLSLSLTLGVSNSINRKNLQGGETIGALTELINLNVEIVSV